MLGRNGKNNRQDNIATTVTEVSERVTLLIREEIELARAEVTQKLRTLSRGLIGAGLGLAFALLLIPFALMTLAWGLNSALGSVWLGFLIVVVLLLILAAAAFYFAYTKFQVGAPAPQMAIEEAKKIRDTVTTTAGDGHPTAAMTNGGGVALTVGGQSATTTGGSTTTAVSPPTTAGGPTTPTASPPTTAGGEAPPAKSDGD